MLDDDLLLVVNSCGIHDAKGNINGAKIKVHNKSSIHCARNSSHESFSFNITRICKIGKEQRERRDRNQKQLQITLFAQSINCSLPTQFNSMCVFPFADNIILIGEISARAGATPCNVIVIIHANELIPNSASRAREALGSNRVAVNPGSLTRLDNPECSNVVVTPVPRRPGGGAAGGGSQASVQLELAGAGNGHGALSIEVECARLAGSGGGEVEGEKSRDVGRTAALEDLADAGVVADGTG